jgi:hypothetical protein
MTRATRLAILAAAAAASLGAAPAAAQRDSTRWWKGNTHTHTLWSDGDDFPEMVADWYRRAGYHFVALTDHNTLADAERWWPVPAAGIGREAYAKYAARFGAWVEGRRRGDTLSVRLRRPAEYRARLERPGRFLLPNGEEITQYLGGKAAHVNGFNLAAEVPAQPGATLVEMIRRDLAAVRAQETGGRATVAVLNHPNFLWSQTAEDLLAIPELRFVEIYNGHPLVHVRGDARRPGYERIWDVVQTRRALTRGVPLYGVATDDAHDYHRTGAGQRNAGRGWIVVRAPRLTGDALAAAMQRGDFYASTGVALDDVRRDGRRLSLAIRAEPGVTYTTQWIGTRRGADTAGVALLDSAGAPIARRYSPDVGAVLAESSGARPSYVLRGDELYVRARVVSTKAKRNATHANEVETAWTQPVVP